MEKKDYFYLGLIVLLGFTLRAWGLWSTEIGRNEIINLACGTLSIISMFFVALEFEGIKKGKNAATICALVTSIAPFMINVKSSAPLFFVASIALFFALKVLNHKTKRNAPTYSKWVFFLIASGILVYLHNWGVPYAIAALASIYLFKNKKSSFSSTILKGFSVLLLVSPIIFYILVKMNYLSYQLYPINPERILFAFTDFFSFYTINNGTNLPDLNSLIYNQKTLGIGFFAFVVLPAFIALASIIKDYFKPKGNHFYLLTVALATLCSILVASLVDKTQFITSNLVEIYPILILLMSAGFFTMKSESTKTVLITLFAFLNLFYYFASTFTQVVLIGNF